ncbi:unnamed protein product [Arctogadus glacialis]
MPKFDPNTWQETLGPADAIRAGWLNEAAGGEALLVSFLVANEQATRRGVLMRKGQFESQPGILLDCGMGAGGTVTGQAHRHTDPPGTAVVMGGLCACRASITLTSTAGPATKSPVSPQCPPTRGRAEPAGEDALTALKVTPPGSSTQGAARAARGPGSQWEFTFVFETGWCDGRRNGLKQQSPMNMVLEPQDCTVNSVRVCSVRAPKNNEGCCLLSRSPK